VACCGANRPFQERIYPATACKMSDFKFTPKTPAHGTGSNYGGHCILDVSRTMLFTEGDASDHFEFNPD